MLLWEAEAVAVPHPAVETLYYAPEAVLMDTRSGIVYRLNPSASIVWMFLDGVTPVRRLVLELSEAVDRHPGDLDADVQAVLSDFENKGLLAGPPEASGGPLRLPELEVIRRPADP